MDFKKPDLPGRVSFSKTQEVYEVDFSDYDNDNDDVVQPTENGNANRLEEIYKLHAKPLAEPLLSSATYCCSKKCNSLSQDEPYIKCQPFNETFTDKDDESNKIIEEYRQEIAEINRKHSEERLVAESTDGKIDNTIRSQQQHELKPPTDWNNKDMSKKTIENKSSSIYNAADFAADTSKDSAIIQNYLKVTNQNQIKKKGNCVVKKEMNRNRGGTSAKPPTKPAQQPSKTSVINVREEKRLNEFQLDKVESWMSIHEFDKGDDAAYNQAWRETPQSKTDDEGNFSFEDQLDGESTYDEIVSVIKEIDQDQKHQNIIHPYGWHFSFSIQNIRFY